MLHTDERYQTYLEILQRELVPAMGCTEPVALAYCAAQAREALGALPERIEVEASGNIIKNVKSVIVPNTRGRKKRLRPLARWRGTLPWSWRRFPM